MIAALRYLALTTSLLIAPQSFEPPPPPSVEALSLVAVVQRLVFAVPLGDFIGEANSSAHDNRLDWRSDGCSAPVVHSTGRSFDFTDSCRRHDFAYRNFRRIDRGILWTAPMRRRVDEKFLRDMKFQCSLRKTYDKPSCTAWALIFFHSVRLYAGP